MAYESRARMVANDTARAELERLRGYLASDPGNLNLLQRATAAATAASDYDGALELVAQMIALKPGDAQILYSRAQIEIRAGKLGDAEQTLLAIEATGHKAPEVSAALGHVYFLGGDYGKARAPLAAALEHPDRAPNLAPVYVRTLHQLGEIETAIAFVEHWLETHGADASLIGLLSLLYIDHGDMEKGEALARQSVGTQGENIEALVALGTSALGKQNVDEAATAFQKALARNDSSGRAWLGQGLAQMLALDYEAAERSLRACVKHMPEHIGSWHALAWCQMLRDDYAGAEESFTRSLKIDTRFGESHGGLAVLAALRGDEKKASTLLKRARRLDAKGFSGRFAQSVLLQRAGKTKDADKIVKALLATVDRNALASLISRSTARRH